MKNFFIQYPVAHPKVIYLLTLVIVLLLGAQIPKIKIDTDPENMLAADNPTRQFHNEVKQRFDMSDMIIVGIINTTKDGIYNPQTLSDIQTLSQGILQIDGVIEKDVLSLATVDNIKQEGDHAIRFEWMLKTLPDSEEALNQLAIDVHKLPLLHNTLVSEDQKAAAIYIPIKDKNESYRIAQDIQQLTAGLDSSSEYHITGLPVAEDRFGTEMFIQMGISAPLAGLMIFVLLWVFFRNIPLIIAPMIVAMATVITTMGLLIGLGFTVHIMSSMIAIFLMPIAVVDSVHIMSEFADRYTPGKSVKETVAHVMKHLFTPMLFTSATSTVGFLSLMLTPIPPVQIFGALVGFGILFAYVLTIVFIPAYIVRMSPKALTKLQSMQHQAGTPSRLQSIVTNIGLFATTKSKFILIFITFIFALAIIGIQKIQINDNPVRWFKVNHEIRIADDILNRHFAGTYNAYLVFEDTTDYQPRLKTIIDNALKNTLIPETIKKNIAENKSDINNLLLVIDDATFEASGEALNQLENLLHALESLHDQTKYFSHPESLRYIEELQTYLNRSPLIGKTNSVVDLLKTVNRELHGGQPTDFTIPTTSNGVAQILLQFQSSHRPHDLWHFVTPEYTSTAVWFQMTSGDNQDMSQVIALVDEYIQRHPLPDSISVKWAGKAYLNVVWQQNMVDGMLDSLLSAFVIVFIMMTLLFRSLVFGFLAMLPLSITITIIYGLIGWLGKDYDMPIAVLSALTLGLSVDFAIHFLERSRAYFREGKHYVDTMQSMFAEPANAISRNAIVISIGFTPLLFAPLVPYITVGVFLASIMAISALVTLLVLPGAIKILGRRAQQ